MTEQELIEAIAEAEGDERDELEEQLRDLRDILSGKTTVKDLICFLLDFPMDAILAWNADSEFGAYESLPQEYFYYHKEWNAFFIDKEAYRIKRRIL